VNRDAVFLGIAGTFFGLLLGWILGSQQATPRAGAAPPAAAAAAPAGGGQSAQTPPPLDESRAAALKSTAAQNPRDAATRVQLGNMYFDAERFPEAAQWYEQALQINPRDINARSSTRRWPSTRSTRRRS
jgi:cytochrome c-type biogenesis protein CcmH/NrfG